LRLVDGSMSDFRALERFHYCAGRPATICRIAALRFVSSHSTESTGDPAGRTVGVAILSWPVPVARGRDRAFGLVGAGYARRIRFANEHVRTVSRVIVHPTFRAIGLTRILLSRLIQTCPTRYVEALARMGRAHPLFDRAGFVRFQPKSDDEPVYFLFDRNPHGGLDEIR
jgi:GNAT superfamily N-acetyltransferase